MASDQYSRKITNNKYNIRKNRIETLWQKQTTNINLFIKQNVIDIIINIDDYLEHYCKINNMCEANKYIYRFKMNSVI